MASICSLRRVGGGGLFGGVGKHTHAHTHARTHTQVYKHRHLALPGRLGLDRPFPMPGNINYAVITIILHA